VLELTVVRLELKFWLTAGLVSVFINEHIVLSIHQPKQMTKE
jgi:hypothetical protein